MKCPNCKNKISWQDIESSEPTVIYRCKKCEERMSPAHNYIKVLVMSVLVSVPVGVLSGLFASYFFYDDSSDALFTSEAISLIVACLVCYLLYLRMSRLEIN